MAADFRAPMVFRTAPTDQTPDQNNDNYKPRVNEDPFWVAFIEFFAVTSTAYIASAAYTLALGGSFYKVDQYIPASILIAFLVLVVSLALRQYIDISQQPRHRFLWGGLVAVTLAFSFFLSIIFLLKITDDYSRATFFMQFIGVGIAVLCVRTFAYAEVQSKIATGSVEAARTVVIGDMSGEGLATLRDRTVGNFPFPSFRGNVESDPQTIYELIKSCRGLHPDNIIILAQLQDLPKVGDLANALSEIPASIHLIPLGLENLLGASTMAEISGRATVQLLHPPLATFDRFIKGFFDRLCAVLGLIVLAPLLLMAALAIKLDTRGPVLFRQTRHGFNNAVIRVFKFRTMNVIESGDCFTPATKADPRVTRVGRVLRSSNIDELPQLINVLLGEMSIVGPRPHATAQNQIFDKLLSGFSRRHVVKPGLTGWAQVNGLRGEADTLEKMKRRVEYDLYYVDNWSFLFDLKIIVLTLLSKRAYINAY